MRIHRKIQTGISAAVLIFTLCGMAHALPSAEFTYVETALENGWQYDYTLKNTSDPTQYVGYDLFDVFFLYDSEASFRVLSLPDGWDRNIGEGFGDTFSTWLGPLPDGSDIAPGQSLSGFSFLFDYQAGALPFVATFVNPEDFDYPVIMEGTSAPGTVPVPEPSTMITMLLGLMGVFVVRRYANMTS